MTEPSTYLFDENHFVDSAKRYLAHKYDANDHPPFGKLVLAGSIELLGDRPLGWRLPAFVIGILTIIVGSIACARLFNSAATGWITAAFLSADGFFISYSRIALLDIHLAAAGATVLLVSSFRLNPLTAVLQGVVLGLAASVKLSGVGLLLPIAYWILLSNGSLRRRACLLIVCILSVVTAYCAQYMIGLTVSGQPAALTTVMEKTVNLIERHSGKTAWASPFSSQWFKWVVPTKSINLAFSPNFNDVRVVSSLGNLLLWWFGVATILGAFIVTWVSGLAAVIDTDAERKSNATSISIHHFVLSNGRAVLLILFGCIGYLAPWIFTLRESYIYHFLPIYGFIIVLLAGYVGWIGRCRPTLVILFVAGVLIVTSFYAPVWSYTPVSAAAMQVRLFFHGWR
jgi:dolichyl-phosphate-mannose--protein O-mannosyl transferase